MNFNYTYLEFSSLDYKFNINFKVNEVNYIDSHGDTISVTNTNDSMVFTTVNTSTPIYDVAYHSIENNILDMLSKELNVEIDKETMLKLLQMVKEKDGDS